MSITDVGLGKTYGAVATYRGHPDWTNRYTQRAALTYVTGSHTMKTGFIFEHMLTDNYFISNGQRELHVPERRRRSRFCSARRRIWSSTGPTSWACSRRISGASSKLTLNYGLRFDYVNGYVPVQDMPGTPDDKFYDRFPGVPAVNPWVGTRTFDAVDRHPELEGLQSAVRRVV